MNCREDLEQYIESSYNAQREHLWAKLPNYSVFRHYKSRKWFALIMDIPKTKLGLGSSEIVDVLELRCDPILIGSLIRESGFYPAYHMNKSSWITIMLDNSADMEKVKWLLDMSYETAGKKK